MQSQSPWFRPWVLAPWRCLALVGGVLAVHQVRGWPGPCAPRGTASTYVGLLAVIIIETLLLGFGYAWETQTKTAVTGHALTIVAFQMLGLLAAARRRHALADVLECFRVYGAQLPPGLRGTATTLALAFVVPFHMVLYACDAMAFIPESLARYGVKSVVMSTAFFHLQQVQWSVAFVLMLYPMVVVGSLSADLRRDCSRTAELRLRQSTSSPDKEGLGPHNNDPGALVWREHRLRQHMLYDMCIANIIVHQELIVLVVLCALVSPSLHLSHSLVEITRSSSSRTALVSAITGIVYLLNFAMLSLCCQLFFFESGAMAQVLQGFLVENGSLNGQETQEVSMFIKQIGQQHTFSVWGLFEIDTKFTAAMILAATTHVAVLVQAQTTFL